MAQPDDDAGQQAGALRALSPFLSPWHDQQPDDLLRHDAPATAPTDALINMSLGMALYALKGCHTATPYFDSVQSSAPDLRAQVEFYRGNCALLRGDFEAAAGFFEASLALAADGAAHSPNVARNLAWAYLQVGRSEEALDLMNRLVDAAPCPAPDIKHPATLPMCSSAALSYRAQIHALLFNFDAAVADVDAALTLDPRNPALYVQRGQVVMLLYEWDRVLENYNAALMLDPSYAEAYFHRGLLYYSVLAREEALADFETYLEMQPRGAFAQQAATYTEGIRLELESLGRP